jgi:LacI family transcriptional regulator
MTRRTPRTPRARPASRGRANADARPAAARRAPAGPPPEGAKVTINDIARIAGVSKKTVSRVINRSPLVQGDTRERIEAVIQRYRYVPDPQARGLAFRKSFLVGLVYDNPNAQYIVNVMEGALDGLRGSDFELVVHPCDRQSPELVVGVQRFAVRQKLRGVILLPPVSENDALAHALAEVGCDYVRVSYAQLDAPERMVYSNDREAVAAVAEYLVSLGHRTIGYVTGPAGFMSTRERQEGFAAALVRHGIGLEPGLVAQGGYTYESGLVAGEALLARRPRPTAIFASNDEMAAGVYRAADRAGLSIPADLSIVGYDDTPIAARLLPPLTTVRLPIREIGRAAARRLVATAGGESDATAAAFLLPHLVVRDSCAPPKG